MNEPLKKDLRAKLMIHGQNFWSAVARISRDVARLVPGIAASVFGIYVEFFWTGNLG
jgi:hypothetical protein